MSEINDLEEELKAELKKIRKDTGYDSLFTASFGVLTRYIAAWTRRTGIAPRERR